ncbi:MAG: hypothetical protein GDA56_01140 [Hormoscilla sp. GM7CHS1pb]|nr:hypothetical protein [Hormoscilla sp. GM7CHS1pb]
MLCYHFPVSWSIDAPENIERPENIEGPAPGPLRYERTEESKCSVRIRVNPFLSNYLPMPVAIAHRPVAHLPMVSLMAGATLREWLAPRCANGTHRCLLKTFCN